MFATTTLVGLALIGLENAALAADIDEVTPSAHTQVELAAPGPQVQERRQSHSSSKSKGDRTITRSAARNGNGKEVHRVTATNGHKTVTATRGTSPHNTRVQVSRSNGDRSGSREWDHTPNRSPHPAQHVGNDHGRPGYGPRYDVRGGWRHGHTVRYAYVRPYHGVFVYGPRPAAHVHYVGARGPVQVVQQDLPERAVDRDDSFALGVKGGSLLSAKDGLSYGDPGIGAFARYRPEESVGLELALSHHAGSYPGPQSRTQTQVAGSLELFAFPWTRVSPYVLGGVTWNGRNVTNEVWTGETYESFESGLAQWGLHGGVGLEIALGKSVALDLEGRYIGWLARERGDAPGAVQATGGLLVHF